MHRIIGMKWKNVNVLYYKKSMNGYSTYADTEKAGA